MPIRCTLAVAGYLAVCSFALAQDQERVAALRHYAVLAQNLVPSLADGSPVEALNLEPAALEAKERWRVITLDELDATDRRIRGVAKEAAAAHKQFLELAVQSNDGAAIAALAVTLLTGNPRHLLGAIAGDEARANRYAAAVQRRRAATFLLPELAKELAGPVGKPTVLAVDFDENWFGASPDRINLTNATSTGLTNCTIQVELRGREGRWVRNIHFVPSWPAGKKLWADYHTTDPSEISAISGTSVVEVQEVRVSLWATEFRCDGITINYPSQDRDADRLRQIEDLATFTVDYVARPVFESGPCVGVTLDGVSRLPSCKVEVLCHGGAAGNRVDQLLEYRASNWRKGGRISLQSRGVLEWCPDTFDVTLTIDGFTTPIVRKGLKASWRR